MRVIISGPKLRNTFVFVAFICSVILYTCNRHQVRHGYGDIGLKNEPSYLKVLAPCGEVCQYTGRPVPGADNSIYQQIVKNFNCPNIMKRMAFKNHTIEYPPPRHPPPELKAEFIQYGEMPLKKDRYFVHFRPRSANFVFNLTFTAEKIGNITKRINKGENVNCYNDSRCMMDILGNYKTNFRDAHGVVIGSQSPWLETLLVKHGARHVTTLEYSSINFDHPKMTVYNPYSFAERYLADQADLFDFAATFSSLEHSGLGRYGDPINPYGDMEAMAQIWCMLKPGGMLIVGVPGSFNNATYLEWNANRMYGPQRLTHFAANWKLEEYKRCRDPHIILVLTKRRLVH